MDFVLCRKYLNTEAIRSAVLNLLPLPKERVQECYARVVSLFPRKTALRQHARKNATEEMLRSAVLGQAIPKAFEYPTTQIKIAFCLLLPSHIILTTELL